MFVQYGHDRSAGVDSEVPVLGQMYQLLRGDKGT